MLSRTTLGRIIGCLMVFACGACGPSQPDPTAQSITYRFAKEGEGMHFGDDAKVYLPKNCFDQHESITMHITLQAGTINLHLEQLSLIVKGPLYTDAPQRFVWTPPTATVLRASDPAQQYDWTLPDLEPGMYILVIGDPTSEQATRMLFGVAYLRNFYDVNIPCDQLKAE